MDTIKVNINNFDFSIDPDNLRLVGDALIDKKGLVSHHIDSANRFYKDGIKEIIVQGFKIENEIINKRSSSDEDKSIKYINCKVFITDISIKPPRELHFKTGKEQVLYPTQALVNEKFYSGNLYINAKIKAVAHLHNGNSLTKENKIENFQISRVPIIKGSILCNTYGMSKEALRQIGEDPSDPGGYFIVKGEWAVDCTENSTFNQPKIYNNEGYKNSRVRCEFISKPGDSYQNSDQLLINLHTDDTLTINISRDSFKDVKIPFFLLFRALGWNNDKELMDWIVYDYNSVENKEILNLLKLSMKTNYDNPNDSKESDITIGKKYRDIYDQVEAIKAIVNLIPKELTKK